MTVLRHLTEVFVQIKICEEKKISFDKFGCLNFIHLNVFFQEIEKFEIILNLSFSPFIGRHLRIDSSPMSTHLNSEIAFTVIWIEAYFSDKKRYKKHTLYIASPNFGMGFDVVLNQGRGIE